jgi:hypothetical protein
VLKTNPTWNNYLHHMNDAGKYQCVRAASSSAGLIESVTHSFKLQPDFLSINFLSAQNSASKSKDVLSKRAIIPDSNRMETEEIGERSYQEASTVQDSFQMVNELQSPLLPEFQDFKPCILQDLLPEPKKLSLKDLVSTVKEQPKEKETKKRGFDITKELAGFDFDRQLYEAENKKRR